MIPVSTYKGSVVKGEFLCRMVCRNPEGAVECDKIISIDSSGYIVGRAVPENEITGTWTLEIELLHSGFSTNFRWTIE